MPNAVDVKVTLRGPLFEKKIDKEIQDAIVWYALKRIEKRMRFVPKRVKKALGRHRNPIGPGKLNKKPPTFGLGTLQFGGNVSMTFASTTIRPRRSGKSWQKKNVAIIKSMAPRVMRKTAKRIAAILS